MHQTIPKLDTDEALIITRAFSEALLSTDQTQLTYHQVNGVRLELPSYQNGFVFLSQEDFEKILDIFEGEEYGSRLRAQWELGLPNPTYYDQLLTQAVNAAFPVTE